MKMLGYRKEFEAVWRHKGASSAAGGTASATKYAKWSQKSQAGAYDTHKLLLVLGEPASFHYLIRNVQGRCAERLCSAQCRGPVGFLLHRAIVI